MCSEEKELFIALDIGGSSVKSAVLTYNYKVLKNSFSILSIDSNKPSEQVVEIIISVIKEKINISKMPERIAGIGISFPEFSDYHNGTIAIMKDKFRNSGGVNLRSEIINRIGFPSDFPLIFAEDSISFLRGVVSTGRFKKFNRIIGLTLGTGLGSAFMIDGEIVRNAPDVPKDGELGSIPYKKGIIEDIISKKGIIDLYRQHTGKFEENVRNIAINAENGDTVARTTFIQFGQLSGQILKPYVKLFKAECLVIGGQIAKSYDFFKIPLLSELSDLPFLKKIKPASSIDYAPLYGLLDMIKYSWD